jgi:hypothetical protein
MGIGGDKVILCSSETGPRRPYFISRRSQTEKPVGVVL